jgi:hypothetical protein
MTREEAKKFLPIIRAFAEGKTIETYSYSGMNWMETNNPSFSLCFEYRVKPEPKYHPFNSKEECWEVMLYHKPFGWVIEKENNERFNINSIGVTGVGDYTYRKAFEELVFADGTPFGIEEV